MVNEIGGAAASWGQFVRLTQAARVRNSGLTVNSKTAAKEPQNGGAVSLKHGANVYSSVQSQHDAQAVVKTQSKLSVGKVFDAYA